MERRQQVPSRSGSQRLAEPLRTYLAMKSSGAGGLAPFAESFRGFRAAPAVYAGSAGRKVPLIIETRNSASEDWEVFTILGGAEY